MSLTLLWRKGANYLILIGWEKWHFFSYVSLEEGKITGSWLAKPALLLPWLAELALAGSNELVTRSLEAVLKKV